MPYADPEMLRARNRRYYQEHKETIKARAVVWSRQNPEKVRASRDAWWAANPDYAREWYLRNRATVMTRVREREQRLLQEQPEVQRAKNRDRAARRRSKVRGALVERVDPLVVFERDEGICGICGLPADPDDWHVDHVVPIARGGEHSYLNVQVAHPKCNQRKATS